PALYYLLERAGLKHIADRIVAIAGMKLNEESEFVNAFAEAYTRLVIYPSRSLLRHTDDDLIVQERSRSSHINMAATRQMIRLKHEGRLVLVFPSGTRYREGQPDTKRGVKEVDSYLKLFDYAVLVGIAGNVLRISPSGDMSKDLATRDLILLNVSQPFSCREFRETARANTPKGVDPKQYAADRVMEELAKVHEETARERVRRLSEN
ncbi:MAG: 1-acyl-sn-glycerol-3-phosphate acyltransferase, partial [Spirochaetota bacterium]